MSDAPTPPQGDARVTVPLLKRLAQFVDHAFQASFEGCDLEGSEIQDMGVARGLLIQSEFDPKRHTNSTGELEAGDNWYEYSSELKAALSAAPQSTHSTDDEAETLDLAQFLYVEFWKRNKHPDLTPWEKQAAAIREMWIAIARSALSRIPSEEARQLARAETDQ